ncbi:hypothetical protein, Retrotransposon, partial [Trachipleistophora hominis]
VQFERPQWSHNAARHAIYFRPAVILAEFAHELESSQQKISDWCGRWRMSLSIGKCGTMVFGPKEVHGICFKELPFPTIDSYTYLGLPLTPNLDLNVVIRDEKEKAVRAHRGMRPFLTMKSVPATIKMQLVKSVLLPISTYGC